MTLKFNCSVDEDTFKFIDAVVSILVILAYFKLLVTKVPAPSTSDNENIVVSDPENVFRILLSV